MGIIGCGWVAETRHLPVLSRLEGVRAFAACDTREDRLQQMKTRFEIPRTFTDAEELLSDTDVNAVLIATTAETHASLATKALEAGKHVLLEKPMAMNTNEAEALAVKARQSGLIHMVGFNYRFQPLALEFARAISDGAVGTPAHCFIAQLTALDNKAGISGYETDPARGGGVFYDKAVHAIDMIRFLFKAEVEEARASARSDTSPHDSALVELVLSNGIQCTGFLSTHAAPDHSCSVIGDEGKASISLMRPTGIALYRKEFSRSRIAKLSAYARQYPRRAASIWRGVRSGGWLAGYIAEWRHFLGCIESGSPAIPNFDDGLAVTRTIDMLLASLKNS